MQELLEKDVREIRDDLVENYENGTLLDYLNDRVLEVKKNGINNELEYLVFTIGGPYIELDMGVQRPGVVCGYDFSKKAFAPIPRYDIWEDIELEILNMFGELE